MRALRQAAVAVATVALLASVALPAAAQSRHRGDGPVDVTLVDRDEGLTLPVYSHRGEWWVPGTPGHRYAVRLTNRSPERVLVVLSVDGVNALSGQTASPDQGGYVLEPWQSTEITGWRKSMRDIAQFYFSDSRDSYAARTGRPRDVGVVGVAVFEEARRWNPPARIGGDGPYRERSGAMQEKAAPAAPSSAPGMAGSRAQAIGTGHGYREYSPVTRTGFVRASRTPVQVTELRYEDAYLLAQRGIGPSSYRDRDRDGPRAFPGGFVPDPPRRRW